MGLDPNSRSRFNLKDAAILLLDATPMGMSVMHQIIQGLGARNISRCTETEKARAIVRRQQLDLAIVDALAPSGEGYEFVRWLRREGGDPNRFIPVVITTSHTPRSQVSEARDCGAHIAIRKPFAPVTLLERIIWSAKEGRRFVVSDEYIGPDRRFHDDGPPDGMPGRRREDAYAAAQAEAEAEAAQEIPARDHEEAL